MQYTKENEEIYLSYSPVAQQNRNKRHMFTDEIIRHNSDVMNP